MKINFDRIKSYISFPEDRKAAYSFFGILVALLTLGLTTYLVNDVGKKYIYSPQAGSSVSECKSWATTRINDCTLNDWSANKSTCQTGSRNISMKNDSSGATQVRYINIPGDIYCNTVSNNDSRWGNWTNFEFVKQWTLSEGTGDKKVCAQFKDNSGNVSGVCGGKINYVDSGSSPSCNSWVDVKINNCTQSAWSSNSSDCKTNSNNVTLKNNNSGATQVRYINTARETYCSSVSINDSGWSGWMNYSSSISWTLNDSYGEKKVCAQFKNSRGESPICGGLIRYQSSGGGVGISNQAGFEMEGIGGVTSYKEYIRELQPVWLRMDLIWPNTVHSNGTPNWQSSEWKDVLSAVNTLKEVSPSTKIILTFKGTPSMYRDGNYGNLQCWRMTPNGSTAFQSFVKQVTQKLGSSVNYYEFWNEPDASASGFPADQAHLWGCWIKNNNESSAQKGGQYYASRLVGFSQAVKSGNPNAKVVAGALAFIGDTSQNPPNKNFIDGWLSTNNRNFDYLSFHHYSDFWSFYNKTWYINDPSSTHDVADVYGYLLRKLNQYGVSGNVKILLDETGLRCRLGGGMWYCHQNSRTSKMFDDHQRDFLKELDKWARGQSRLGGWLVYTLGGNGWDDTDLIGKSRYKKPMYYYFACIRTGKSCDKY